MFFLAIFRWEFLSLEAWMLENNSISTILTSEEDSHSLTFLSVTSCFPDVGWPWQRGQWW